MFEEFNYGIEIKNETTSATREDNNAETAFENYLSTDGEITDYPN